MTSVPFRVVAVVACAALLVVSCATGGSGGDGDGAVGDPPTDVPVGPLDDEVAELVASVVGAATTFGVDRPRIVELGESGDPRLSWLLVDLMRLYQDPDDERFLVDAFEALTGVAPEGDPFFRPAGDLLLAWDLPAWPTYASAKATVFEALEPRWAPFFADGGATVDWRHVTWGGVFIDDRDVADARAGDRCSRGCIPALVDPPHTSADEGRWLPADQRVFGVTVGDETRAYPVHQLETHEVVQDTLGGRRIALVFCTLCRSAQVFLLDDVPPELVERYPALAGGYDLRTTGLLARSNKLSFERTTGSLVESFTGEALSGPLREAGVVLEQVSVVTSSWGDWRGAHRDSTILARDGGIGRAYDLDPLGDRDDDGPIFPIGAPDPRLDPQDQVVGVIGPAGTPVAFPVVALTTTAGAGQPVSYPVDGVTLRVVLDGDGYRVRVGGTGTAGEVVSHQAFWFAWSQFHPDTELWSPGG